MPWAEQGAVDVLSGLGKAFMEFSSLDLSWPVLMTHGISLKWDSTWDSPVYCTDACRAEAHSQLSMALQYVAYTMGRGTARENTSRPESHHFLQSPQ